MHWHRRGLPPYLYVLNEKIERHVQRIGDEAKRCRGTLSPAVLNVRNIALAEVCFVRQMHLGHAPGPFPLAPPAQNAHRILAVGHAIDDVFRQQRTATGNFLAGPRDNTRGARILFSFGSLGDQKLVVFSRKDCDFATWRLLKSNTHDVLSVIYLSPMSYRSHNDCCLIFIEDHSPIADAKLRPFAPFEALDIAMPGSRKFR